MKVFHCDHCQNLVFFENVECVKCGSALAFLPDRLDVAALKQQEDGNWFPVDNAGQGGKYRLCANYTQNSICNWAVAADDPEAFCVSCRMTQTIPELAVDNNREAWFRLEVAKRRLVYSLLELQLPITSQREDAVNGIAFQFLGDTPAHAGPVLTGHDDGLITINIAEADDAEREKRRVSLHEPYRTLLGHFRHEIGHYYWDRLVARGPELENFRALFGDERADYAAALKTHYEQAASTEWQGRFISSYASSHPWEDWAETWAHYLHMIDSMETSASCGLSIRPPRDDEPAMIAPTEHIDVQKQSFDAMVDDWRTLTYALNNLNRSLGLQDGYPFILPPEAVEKLRFVHELIRKPQDWPPPLVVEPVLAADPPPAPAPEPAPLPDPVEPLPSPA